MENAVGPSASSRGRARILVLASAKPPRANRKPSGARPTLMHRSDHHVRAPAPFRSARPGGRCCRAGAQTVFASWGLPAKLTSRAAPGTQPIPAGVEAVLFRAYGCGLSDGQTDAKRRTSQMQQRFIVGDKYRVGVRESAREYR